MRCTFGLDAICLPRRRRGGRAPAALVGGERRNRCVGNARSVSEIAIRAVGRSAYSIHASRNKFLLSFQSLVVDDDARSLAIWCAGRSGRAAGTFPSRTKLDLYTRLSGLCNFEFESLRWRLINERLGFSHLLLEDFLHPDQPFSCQAQRTDLEVTGQVEHFASVFVVFPGILPNVADLFLKCSPGRKVGYSCRRGAAVNTTDPLGDALERHGVLDDLIVIQKGARRKIGKGGEYL
jgi:hypothetical protein